MKHVMLDIETLGTSPGSVITSIGAVRFDHRTVGDPLQISVDIESSINAGLGVDGSTLAWWLSQSDTTRRQFALPSLPIATALDLFARWIDKDDFVWGNGVDFDNVLLSAAYEKCGRKLPWRWSRNRCYRTLKNLYPEVALNREGEHHVAQDDAVSQAKHAAECMSFLRVDLGDES